jgi:hypothetical protein
VIIVTQTPISLNIIVLPEAGKMHEIGLKSTPVVAFVAGSEPA